MAMYLSSKQQRATFHSLDRLSNLPTEVTDEIFKRMLVRDAVKTSLLSTVWRYKWTSMPDLVFDTHSIPIGGQRTANLVNFVNYVLLLHNGNISKFEINNFIKRDVPDVDRWVVVLSRTTLNHLVLKLLYQYQVPIPSCLFKCENLKTLQLEGCKLRLPSQYKGFKYLTHVGLCNVNLASETIENLVNRSPSLQSLKVWNCIPLNRLNLYAPNLLRFSIKGCCEGVNFQHTPKLLHLVICTLWKDPVFCSICRLDDILANVGSISHISMSYPFMEFSPADILPKRLHLTYNCLKTVKMIVNLKDSKKIFALLCLFRSSPYIEDIRLQELQGGWSKPSLGSCDKHFWEGRLCKEGHIFNHLKTVSLAGFEGAQHELDFTKYILLNAVALETFSIKWNGSVNKEQQQLWSIFEKMMQFQRASCEAKVVFPDQGR